MRSSWTLKSRINLKMWAVHNLLCSECTVSDYSWLSSRWNCRKSDKELFHYDFHVFFFFRKNFENKFAFKRRTTYLGSRKLTALLKRYVYTIQFGWKYCSQVPRNRNIKQKRPKIWKYLSIAGAAILKFHRPSLPPGVCAKPAAWSSQSATTICGHMTTSRVRITWPGCEAAGSKWWKFSVQDFRAISCLFSCVITLW